MMYGLKIKPEADGIFKKLEKKNIFQLRIINKKIQELREQPYHRYKFLRRPLQMFNRVHINTHFVLIFQIDHDKEVVEVYYYGHHDEVYDWRPKGL